MTLELVDPSSRDYAGSLKECRAYLENFFDSSEVLGRVSDCREEISFDDLLVDGLLEDRCEEWLKGDISFRESGEYIPGGSVCHEVLKGMEG